MRFLCFYLMKDSPDQVRAVAPEHVAYWQALSLRDYLGGPFGDRSGGLIIFESRSAEDAERFVDDGPVRPRGRAEGTLSKGMGNRLTRWRRASQQASS